MAKRVASALHGTLGKAQASYTMVTTQQKGDGRIASSQAEQNGYTHVIAVGGDGTINEIASGLVGTPVILGIIPAGSGNGLARALEIPLDERAACCMFLQAEPRSIDVGQVNGRYFFATSGIGFDAHVGKLFNDDPTHPRGILPYVWFSCREFFQYTPQTITIDCNGSTFRSMPLVCTVANSSQYGGGAIIAPHALPDDGLFDIIILPKTTWWRLLPHLHRIFSGTIDRLPGFLSYRTDALTITRSAPGPVHVDGESFMAGEELEYKLIPHALNVQVHQDTVAAV